MWSWSLVFAATVPETPVAPLPSDLVFTDLAGARRTLAEHQGKVVLLDFWATWCGPCKAALSTYDAWQGELGERGLVVVAVSVDDTLRPVPKFLATHCPRVTAWWDPNHGVAERLALSVMPTTWLLDREGVAVYRHEGFDGKDSEPFKARVTRVLDGLPAAD